MIFMLEGLKKLFGGAEQQPVPSRESRLIESYLGCECLYIPAKSKQKEVRRIFAEVRAECAGSRVIPVLISVSDNLAETIFENAGIEYPEGDTIPASDMEKAAAFRDRLLSQCSDSDAEDFFRAGEEEITKALEDEQFRKEIWENKKIAFDDVIPEMGAFVDMKTLKSHELLLARIPAAEPWHIPAWLPMGGWNSCPSPKAMLAIAKRWYEKYRAVICSVTSDELEFRVSSPPSDPDEAMQLAKEFSFLCMDRLCQYGGDNTLATIADGVTRSPYWYFWWD